jgi:hypothetical protein
MKIITNDKLISRNAKFGLWTSVISLVFLIGSVIVIFQSDALVGIAMILLAFGFLLSQVGAQLGNKYSRRPRPDERLNTALKGLDREYTLYHYRTPVSHLMVGPNGVWVLVPRTSRGNITYQENKGRWKQQGGNLYLKIIGQEGLGRPDLEITADIQTLNRFFNSHFEEDSIPPIQAALVFTHPESEVNAKNASVPTLPISKLKGFIRKGSKNKQISKEMIREINSLFGE